MSIARSTIVNRQMVYARTDDRSVKISNLDRN